MIIDDLTALNKAHDGVNETLAAMRELRKLCDELPVSVLAITSSAATRPGKAVSEQELKQSDVLCSVAYCICRACSFGGGVH